MTALRTALHRRTTKADGGFTVVEMVVVVFILGVVLAMVQGALLMAQHNTGDTKTRLDQVGSGKTAIEAMSKTLRTAVRPSQLSATCSGCEALAAFMSGDARSVKFYANIDNPNNVVGPSKVSYSITSDGDLVETIQPPNAHAPTDFNYQYCTPGAPGCEVFSRTLATGIPAGSRLFTYYDASGTALPNGTLSAAQLAGVDQVDVVVTVKASPVHSSTTFTQRVALPNADAFAQTTT